MLFLLDPQEFPNAVHTSVIPEEHAGLALLNHEVNVTIDDACTLIRQTFPERGYSIWINYFFIKKPLRLYVRPEQQLYSSYSCIENNATLTICKKTLFILKKEEERSIQQRDFAILDLPRGEHYGDFTPGIYKSLHLTVDKANRETLTDPAYLGALLREYLTNYQEGSNSGLQTIES